ncbi:MAG: YidC/Oxa1 family membrane protein insertase [Peptococcaceae bacterium]|nr:YidC/Oxa1 family membrane protein insertase [Peptococcaceae bacterium]
MSTFVDIMTQFIHTMYEFTGMIGFPSYALAIIFIGIVVRIILLPLTVMQMKSMLGMQEIQPELAELQKRYANNREKLSEEMMKLYKEYDVRPMAGCLPMLIQLPILYLLFWALRNYQFTENASFLWIDSLNNIDPLHIMAIVLAVAMFLQQKLAMSATTMDSSNPANMTMKMMVYVMPVMMGFMALNFPSGLCLYWITTSVFMIFQQLFMNSLRKKEMAKRAEARAIREAEREKQREEEKKQGHNKSKKKTKQQLKNEHKARKREAQYQAPKKDGEGATYHPPKKS